jgi:EAL domain-containing protein (putative c-di-GMP-specific phosphodiesterase class I)
LPLNRLKIDRSFVHDIAQDPDAMTLAQIIIAMAHQLQLSVVAEGVETPAQRDLLIQWHCDEMQGFLFSKAVPAQLIPDLVHRHLRERKLA